MSYAKNKLEKLCRKYDISFALNPGGGVYFIDTGDCIQVDLDCPVDDLFKVEIWISELINSGKLEE